MLDVVGKVYCSEEIDQWEQKALITHYTNNDTYNLQALFR